MTTIIEARSRRFTRDEYHKMADLGFFEDQRVELIDGEIIEMPAQNEPHVEAISRMIREIAPILPDNFELRCQAPLAIAASEPEPDLAIISLPKPKNAAPDTAALVVEVAESSLVADRKKSHLYASAQIPEYWIINLNDRRLERFLNPVSDISAPFSARYATTASVALGETLQPVAVLIKAIKVGDLFPSA
jgi:Uma2 family endonuclease